MRLERVGDEIASLRHSQWIVMNNDDRHRREIRTVVDRMVKFVRGYAELFSAGGLRDEPAAYCPLLTECGW